MRLWWKLSLIVGIAAAGQWLAERHAAELDEAAFVLRVGCEMCTRGGEPSEELMNVASRLIDRDRERRWAAMERRAAGS